MEPGISGSGMRGAADTGMATLSGRQPAFVPSQGGDRPARGGDKGVRAAKRVVADLFGDPLQRRFNVRYWDGTEELSADAAFTFAIERAGALRRMLLPPTELSLVEAYLYGDIDVTGDIEAAASLGDIAIRRIGSVAGIARVLRHVLALPSDAPPSARSEARVARRLRRFGPRHSARRDARAVRFHYDVGNEFYALWLDRQMVYSCAYFAPGESDLDAAQAAKLDLVCRKLRLGEGERFLDIGCGWGALVIHAARQYGVHATGITLSEQQAAYARARVAREGLEGRVTIQIRDYRTLGEMAKAESYDKIASVGMVEHVGEEKLDAYFAAVHRALMPGGLFLNHGIVRVAVANEHPVRDAVGSVLWQRNQFIRRYVFPDGRIIPASVVLASAERGGFEVRDVESLREHYASTLRHWVRGLEHNEARARALVGDVTYRVWRLYMAAAAYGFRTARIGVIQSLLAKPDSGGAVWVPRTRDDLYRD